LAKGTGPAKFLDGHARASLFEETNDLLIGKFGLFDKRYSPKLADFVPSLWYSREGAGQKHGLGRVHTQAAIGNGCVTFLLLRPLQKGMITGSFNNGRQNTNYFTRQ